MKRSALLVVVALIAAVVPARAQEAEVRFASGLVSVHCDGAPLSSVFEQLEELAGVELILEEAVESTPLTASLDDVPVAMAVQRLLEGSGVVFAVMMDPRDWGRVDKVFVGAPGGGPARQARAPRPPARPEPADEEEDDYDDYDDEEEVFDDMIDEADPEDMESLDEVADPDLDAPPVDVPTPSYLPPQQQFPRSRFTPGPPNQQQGAQPFPFLDPFGQNAQPQEDPNQQQQQQRQRRPPPNER